MISPIRRIVTACVLLAGVARAQNVVVGVNVVNPMRASVADQNTLLSQLKAADVRVIRCSISNDDKGIDFAKRSGAQGIHIQLIVGSQYTPNAPLPARCVPRNVGRTLHKDPRGDQEPSPD
jgi:hypothetical protein